ncbi:ATP-binding protein [Saccharicrinis aurantiacus]|uniref:ATP-binding protein n=1 Tax=Saccharicrinis aurantiacus TaxID=1849719 RepID=UPI000839210E|nr:ATP-grasp domain-containing protein [Saccharicrinis aurantiacus]
MKTKNAVVILGLQSQGLFLAKAIQPFVSNIIGISNVRAIGCYSKHINSTIVNSDIELKAKLERIYERYGRIKLFVTSGTFLDFIINNSSNTLDLFDVQIDDFSKIMYFSNKWETYKLCDVLGIKYPKLVDLNALKNNTFGNIIAKWSREDSIFNKRSFKTCQFKKSDNINSFLDANSQYIENGSIIIQELLDKKIFNSVSYLGSYKDGEEQGGIGVKQLRQYPIGITSAIKSLDAESENLIKEIASKLMRKTRYSGFAEVEFLTDDTFNQIYLIEVNPRLCGWSSALQYKYTNIGSFILGKESILNKEQTSFKNPLIWVNITRDIIALFKELIKNKSIFTFLYGLKTTINAGVYDGIYDDEKLLLLKYYMNIR